MKQFTILLLTLFAITSSYSQEITGEELLEKAIKYHDPEGKWETFNGTLFVTMKTPNKPDRNSEIKINFPEEYFYVKATQGANVTEYAVHKGDCSIAFNGDTNPSDEVKKKNNLSCDRAKLYDNYYSYLYGLPMKLKDPGTIIHKQVNLDKFMGEMYLVLKVTYKEDVGNDTWYFYFDPETYALETYQFLKDSKPNTGEYILLSGIETINGIKIPKKRDWYYNKNQQYLGTDLLVIKSKE
jgi:hypothetical protein